MPWVACYDSSGNMLGSTQSATSVTSVLANSANQATIAFSGTTTATCVLSTGSMGPGGATGPAGDTGPAGPTGPSGPTGAGYGGTSATSLVIATGTQTFTTQTGLAYSAGARVRANSAADGANYMEGLVTSYSGSLMTVNADAIGGSGTHGDWNLNLAGSVGAQGPQGPAGPGSGNVIASGALTAGNVMTGGGGTGIQDSGVALSSLAQLNGTATYGSTAVVDARAAAHTFPSRTGAAASKPATCTAGEEYFATDSTAGQNKWYCTATNTWTQQTGAGGGSPLLFAQTTTQSGDSITNTAAETAFATGYTIAKAIAAGNVIHIRASGTFNNNTGGGSSLVVAAYLAGVKVCQATSKTLVALPATYSYNDNESWYIDCNLTVRTAGTSGSLVSDGSIMLTGTTITGGAYAGFLGLASAAYTVNTSSPAVAVKAQMGSASSNFNVAMTQLRVEMF